MNAQAAVAAFACREQPGAIGPALRSRVNFTDLALITPQEPSLLPQGLLSQSRPSPSPPSLQPVWFLSKRAHLSPPLQV